MQGFEGCTRRTNRDERVSLWWWLASALFSSLQILIVHQMLFRMCRQQCPCATYCHGIAHSC